MRAEARNTASDTKLGQTSKIRQKLDWKISCDCPATIWQIWMWSACSDRKRKLYEFGETFLEKLVKSNWANSIFGEFQPVRITVQHEARKQPPQHPPSPTGVLLLLQFSPPDRKCTFTPRISAIKVILLAKHNVNGHIQFITSAYIIEVSSWHK